MNWYKIAKSETKTYNIYMYGEGEGVYVGWVYAVSLNQAKYKANNREFEEIVVPMRKIENMATRGYVIHVKFDSEKQKKYEEEQIEIKEFQKKREQYKKEKYDAAAEKWQNMYD
jgi:hypothetical protein